MHFGVLGPVEVVDGTSPVAVSAAKERALLAVLLAGANRALSADALVDELWGDEPPRSATKTLQTYISHLRRCLGDRLRTVPGGYLLHVEDGELDAARFESKLVEGRLALLRGDHDAASQALARALDEWRGDAYGGETGGRRVAADAVRLLELRVDALEDWYEARLGAGQHRVLCAELEAAVATHPLREILWGLLMRALVASGRQAEALRAFQRARDALGEVGLEPGQDLRAVEAAVLGHEGRPHGQDEVSAPRYVTTSDGLRIAYFTVGSGDHDLVFLGEVYLNIELLWDISGIGDLIEALARRARVIVVQRRGTGLSDREGDVVLGPPEACVADVDAVLADLAATEVDLLGWGHGGQVALAYAAARPERVKRVVVLNGYARLSATAGYPPGIDAEVLEWFVDFVGSVWGTTRPLRPIFDPEVASDASLIARISRVERLSASPGQAMALHRALNGLDVRTLLPKVLAPVLVIHLTSSVTGSAVARWLADHLPAARFIELPGYFVPTGAHAVAAAEVAAEHLSGGVPDAHRP